MPDIMQEELNYHRLSPLVLLESSKGKRKELPVMFWIAVI
jgi:hypothetical protein